MKNIQTKSMNNKLIVLIVIFMGLIVTLLGVTYAFFSVNVNNDNPQEVSLETKKVGNIAFQGDAITLEDAVPGSLSTGSFSIAYQGKQTDNDVSYSLKIVVTENGYQNTDASKGDITVSVESDKLAKIYFPFAGDNTNERTIIENQIIKPGEVQTYNTIVEFVDTNTDQNINQGKSFKAHIEIYNIASA